MRRMSQRHNLWDQTSTLAPGKHKTAPAAETERMMKLQDVLLKAMAKMITWWEAAEIIGVADRERLETHGYSGLVGRNGRPRRHQKQQAVDPTTRWRIPRSGTWRESP